MLQRTVGALALMLWAGNAAGQITGEVGQFGRAGTPGDGLPAVLDVLNQLPVTIVDFDAGGRIYEYDVRWRAVGAAGGQVAVLGQCQSACTLLVAHIPRARLCFGDYSSLNFHHARLDDGTPAVEATKWMIARYPEDIRGWIMGRGGAAAIPMHSYWRLTAQELWHMGYRRCE